MPCNVPNSISLARLSNSWHSKGFEILQKSQHRAAPGDPGVYSHKDELIVWIMSAGNQGLGENQACCTVVKVECCIPHLACKCLEARHQI